MNDTTTTNTTVDDEAAESIGGGDDAALPAAPEALLALLGSFSRTRSVSSEAVRLGWKLAKIALRQSDISPAVGDRRFTDPAWTTNPFYRRVLQMYLASTEALDRIVRQEGPDAEDSVRAQMAVFASTILSSAAAPTNYLLTNPAAIKEAFDTGGMSLVRGMANALADLRHNRGMPSMAERGAFEVGVDLAVTPGEVVSRDDVAELLQYTPSTPTVYERPVLMVPPPIGRYYFLDLRPGRSFVEYLVQRSMQTFMLSWRNPGAEQGDWNLNTYAARVSDALDEVRHITGSADVNVIGFCAGGIIATALLNHLAAQGDTRVHSMSYAVTLLDFEHKSQLAAFAAPGLLKFAKQRSRRNGIISAHDMSGAFTWMRPDDLVFNYVVNNYLMGRKPPAFDILAWNADGTNLPGALHGQFLDIFAHNLLVKRNAMKALGTPIDLGRIALPTFVSGAVADHLTPWKNCYRTTQLLGGDSTFVLSHSGHIASLVNPPGNPKAHYWSGGEPGPDPDAWREAATRHTGSWWEAWAEWLTPKAGDLFPAPGRPGSDRQESLGAAPGHYVRDQDRRNK